MIEDSRMEQALRTALGARAAAADEVSLERAWALLEQRVSGRPKWRRWSPPLAAAAAVLILFVALLVTVQHTLPPRPEPPARSVKVVIDASPRLVSAAATASVPGPKLFGAPSTATPGLLRAGFGSLWATVPDVEAVQRYDAVTGRLTGSFPADIHEGGDLEAGPGLMWVEDGTDLVGFDPRTLHQVRRFRVGETLGSIVATGNRLWVAAVVSGRFEMLDATTGAVLATVSEGQPGAIGAAGGHVWLALRAVGGSGQVFRADATTGRVERRFTVPEVRAGSVGRIVEAGGAVWVADEGQERLLQVDAVRGTTIAAVDGFGGSGLVVDGAALWVLGGPLAGACCPGGFGHLGQFSTIAARRIDLVDGHSRVAIARPRGVPPDAILTGIALVGRHLWLGWDTANVITRVDLPPD